MTEDSEDWVVEIKMGITETRLLYNHICNTLDTHPYPRKIASSENGNLYMVPYAEEYAYLNALRNKLFAIICEYSFDMEEFNK